MYIYIKPHKRCDKCGHLVSTDGIQCPYCGGTGSFSRPTATVIKATNELFAKNTIKRAKPIDKRFVKYGIVAVGVIALIITTIIIIVNSLQIRKSVLEPIDMEYAIEKNEKLQGFSEMCQKVNSSRYAFNDSSAYKEITYKRLYEFYHDFYNNSDSIDIIRQSAIKEHEENIRKPLAMNIQSILDEWSRYVREHDINNYLHVNIITSYFEQEIYYNTYYRPKFYFDLSYPSGKKAIKDCSATFSIDYGNIIYDRIDLASIKENSSSDGALYLRNVDNSRFWDNYTATITINSVTLSDGTRIYANDINNVPYCIKMYQANKSLENEERVILDLINSNYTTQSEYVNNKINQELMAKDSLCYEFVTNFIK